ncbi:MAG: TlpA family protein disulfide reductase [Pyrinomonadaceae bacterium]
MRLFGFYLAVFIFLAGLACRPAAAPVAVGNKPISINDRPTTNMPAQPAKPLAEMSWTDANDRVHKVGDLKGKAVILDFWATYCEPCKREIPHLNSLIAKYGPDSLHIVGLNVGGEEDAPKIPDFVKTTKMDYDLAFPEEDLTRYIFAERSDIPQTLVIDRSGNIVTKIIGFSPVIQKELDAAVEKAVGAAN